MTRFQSRADGAVSDPVKRPPALDVGGLSHSFGPLQALKEVSFTLERGEFCALLGVNGAGKTTLFSLITRLYTSTSGEIRLGGYDVRQNPRAALSRMGVVFQNRALDGDLSLMQNLQYHAALHGIARGAARARIADVLSLVKLEDKATARAATLSGGQQRRAEIARALLHRPEVLLLDEATAGLDLRARAEIIALIRDLIASQGVSALWATHIFEEIEPKDRVVMLHQGRVLADGRAADLAGESTLSEAFLDLTGAGR